MNRMRQFNVLLACALASTLAACAGASYRPTTSAPAQTDGLVRAGLGQTVTVGGPKVTPIEVLEDSRCPMNARCVWAGQVRLKVRVRHGAKDDVLDLVQGKPVHVADGMLELVEVQPDKVAGERKKSMPKPSAYRFGFSFAGSI